MYQEILVRNINDNTLKTLWMCNGIVTGYYGSFSVGYLIYDDNNDTFEIIAFLRKEN